jgi:hypothetical protein
MHPMGKTPDETEFGNKNYISALKNIIHFKKNLFFLVDFSFFFCAHAQIKKDTVIADLNTFLNR